MTSVLQQNLLLSINPMFEILPAVVVSKGPVEDMVEDTAEVGTTLQHRGSCYHYYITT